LFSSFGKYFRFPVIHIIIWMNRIKMLLGDVSLPELQDNLIRSSFKITGSIKLEIKNPQILVLNYFGPI
ncbi:MAG: hypothetical protein ACK2TU_04595, partial [Anaerolineales bacterium]